MQLPTSLLGCPTYSSGRDVALDTCVCRSTYTEGYCSGSVITLSCVCDLPPGLLRTLMFYPLDFSRTRLTADTTPAGQQRPFVGIASCLRHAWATQGIRSWYQGMGMSLPGVVVYTSISFTAYDSLKVGSSTGRLIILLSAYRWGSKSRMLGLVGMSSCALHLVGELIACNLFNMLTLTVVPRVQLLRWRCFARALLFAIRILRPLGVDCSWQP